MPTGYGRGFGSSVEAPVHCCWQCTAFTSRFLSHRPFFTAVRRLGSPLEEDVDIPHDLDFTIRQVDDLCEDIAHGVDRDFVNHSSCARCLNLVSTRGWMHVSRPVLEQCILANLARIDMVHKSIG